MCEIKGQPPSAQYVLAYEEGFDKDELDLNEWQFRTGTRFESIHAEDCVMVKDSRLWLSFERCNDGIHKYRCGGIISKRVFGYGYYEAKARLWGKPGVHSSFWSMGLNGGDGEIRPKYNTIVEIDGYEIDSSEPSNIAFNYHWYVGRHCSRGHSNYNEVGSEKEDFIAGYEWLPGKINFYINNKLVHTIHTSKVLGDFYGQQNVFLTALAWDIDGKAEKEFAKGSSSWDYFRFYKRNLKDVNLIANPVFSYNTYRTKRDSLKKDKFYPIGWLKSGCHEASYVKELDDSCVLCHESKTPYWASNSQKIDFLVEGTYSLKLIAKSTGGQDNAYAAIKSNEENLGTIQIKKSEEFIEYTLENIQICSDSCLIEIFSSSQGGTSAQIAHVAFFQTNGEADEDLIKQMPDFEIPLFSEKDCILIDDFDEGFSCVGEWCGGATLGYDYGPTSFTHIMKEQHLKNNAKWTPNIKEDGRYKVSFFVSSHPNSAKDALLTVVYKDGQKTFHVDFSTAKNYWLDLGEFDFPQGEKGYVKLSATSVGSIIRADAVKFQKV